MHDHATWRRPSFGRGLLFSFFVVTFCVSTGAADVTPFAENGDGNVLTHNDAIARALAGNSALKAYAPRLRQLDGLRASADQSPAYEFGLEAENVLGTGEFRGLEAVELTLALSSVLELGEKRQARVDVVQSQAERLQTERRAEALALVATVTRQYIEVLAAQERMRLSAEAIEQSSTAIELLGEHVTRGAAPEAELLRSRARLARDQLLLQRQRTAHRVGLERLAELMGEDGTHFSRVEGDLYRLPAVESFDDLMARVGNNPAIEVFASEERLREAEMRLVQAQSRSDLRWQAGVRYLGETGDGALVAGLTVPLFSDQRNRGQLRAAQAALDEVDLRRSASLRSLRTNLYQAWSGYEHAVREVVTLGNAVIPDLRRALALTRTGFEGGRYGYIDWRSAQHELMTAERDRLESAVRALMNLSEIEQLTATPVTAAAIPAASPERTSR